MSEARCPICNFELEATRRACSNGQIVVHYYTCPECEKHFELKEFDIGERIFGKHDVNVLEDEK